MSTTTAPQQRSNSDRPSPSQRRPRQDTKLALAFIAPVDEDNTFYVSVTTHGADVTALVVPSLEDIWANRLPAATLTETNDAINILFEADE